MGREEFYSNKNYSHLYDVECPICFLFLYQTFFEIYSYCSVSGGIESRKSINWNDIYSYCALRNLRLSQFELNSLLKIIKWADEQINEMNNE